MADFNSSIITTTELLERACGEWRSASALALDTEFIRTNTFYPIPALIQIFDGKQCYLIDPITIPDLSALKDILVSPHTIKVLHSCSEDLEVFDRLFQTLPSPLFDTQIAAAFLGYGFSAGYAKLIKTLYNIDIPKDETRSNWLQRPLTDSQLHYAALDVVYLYQLYGQLSNELLIHDKNDWVSACNAELSEQFRANQQADHYFSRLKNSWRLDPEQQKTLLQLVLWRENLARTKNKPRSHIVNDELLFELAIKKPTTLEQFRKLRELSPGIMKYHSQELLDLLNRVDSINQETGLISGAIQEPLPRMTGEILKHLKSLTDQTAEQLNVAPEMLARKKDLHLLVSSFLKGKGQLPSSLAGWRKPIIGYQLLEATQQWHQKQQAV